MGYGADVSGGMIATSGSSAYAINRSLRFRSSASAYLNRTPASASNQQKWTWSGWVKRGVLGTANQIVFDANPSGITDSTRFLFYFSSSDNLIVDGAVTNFRTTSAVFRDPSSWYHLVLSVDTTQATATNRILVYVNGVSQSFSTNNAFTQNANTAVNSTTPHYMATLAAASTYFDGYLAEVNFVDGQALTPFAFGNFNPTTGVWGANKYVGTYGTNGFYLPFTNNTALTVNSNTGLGQDFSGNSNYWITNNVSLTAGITYDSMTDVPTLSAGTASNYATLNPLAWRFAVAQGTFSNGNLGFTYSGGSSAFAFGSMGVSTGRWYFEGTLISRGLYTGGIGLADIQVQWGIFTNLLDYGTNGLVYPTSTTLASYNSNDVIGVAFDLVASVVYFYKNGALQGNLALTPGVTYFPLFDAVGNAIWAANFGQQPFVYSPPSGFSPLNTYNLPSPTIPAGNVAVNAITYTGGSSTPPGLGQVPKRTASTLAPVNSLRFRSGNSGYLNRTPITQGSTTTATLSLWIKRGSLGAGSTFYYMFDAGVWQSGAEVPLSFTTNDQLDIHDYNGSSIVWQLTTNAVFRDTSTWYHIVAAIDSTQPIPANRAILWVNGVQQTQLATAIYPAQNSDTHINSQNIAKAIGRWQSGTSRYYDGYMSEFNFVDGQALTPSAFGTTNTDGQWVPIPYIGTYGTNGYRLPFTGNQTQSFNGSFNGTSQWVSTGTASSRFNLAQGDWTVEAWYFSTSTVSNNARYMVFTPGQALGADTSATNNTITVSGTPTWSQFSPYGTSTQGGSLYFNGTNTSLQSNSSTGNFLFGNANFTVEAWIYPLNITAYQYIASVWGVIGGPGDNAQSCWQIRINTSGNFEAVLNNGATTTVITGSTVLFLRQWQHVAMVRNGNTITLFVNGVNVNTTTYTSTLNNVPTTQFVIGQQLPSSYYFNGYMTNLRIINGTALYTTTWFTPPTAALPIANSTQTVLLMDVNSASSYITDSSSYSQTFTVNGTLVYNPASPYSPVALGGSAYLNGSTDNFNVTTLTALRLATANTPFTVECWMYPVTQLNGTGIICANYTGGQPIPYAIVGTTSLTGSNNTGSNLAAGWYDGSNWQMAIQTTTNLTLNTWSHIALSYDGTTARLFLNGTQLGSATGAWTTSSINSSLYIGRRWDSAVSSTPFFNGYITNARFVNGISQYGSNFVPQTNSALAAVPGTVLLMNMTSSGYTYGILPSTGTDFNLNLFGIGNLFTTINASMKLNEWQHIALVRSGQTTTLYVDGVASAATVYPWWTNGTVTVFFGGVSGTYANYFQGQISNFRIVMGTAVYTTNFTPSTVPLTVIPGTALLTMNSSTVTDSAGVTNLTNNNSVAMSAAGPFAANVTMDASGNFNHWFPNGIGMFTGSTYDTMTDVPADSSSVAANWLTMNPSFGSTGSLTNANLTFAGTASGNTQRIATMGLSAGKWYFEMTMATNVSSTADIIIGISNVASNMITTYPGQNSDSYAAYSVGSSTYIQKLNNNTFTNTSATQVASGDVIGIAFDLDNLKFWIAKNGVWVDSGNPSAGTNPQFTMVSGTYVPSCRASGGTGNSSGNLNFGQQPFAYTPPTGFNVLNTYTNPVTTTWWGNGNTYPDFTWIKSRSAATSHMLMDTLRGPGLYLSSNYANQQWGSGGAYNWSKYGLVLANDGNTNVAGNTYVLWGWTAGQGNAIVNTSGSISSTVSANPTAGFSIVAYTGNGITGATVGHGLGIAPNFIIVKNGRTSPSSWAVYHSSYASASFYQFLDTTQAAAANNVVWNGTAPTSSVFSIGTDVVVNSNANTYIAYCWAAVPGYSAFGSYVGNNNADGPFIYTGFRPRWIMIKNTTNTSDWVINDSVRPPYNADNAQLFANIVNGETSDNNRLIDFLSNGFKIRATGTGENDNNTANNTYIYAAFAENPFKYALAR